MSPPVTRCCFPLGGRNPPCPFPPLYLCVIRPPPLLYLPFSSPSGFILCYNPPPFSGPLMVKTFISPGNSRGVTFRLSLPPFGQFPLPPNHPPLPSYPFSTQSAPKHVDAGRRSSSFILLPSLFSPSFCTPLPWVNSPPNSFFPFFFFFSLLCSLPHARYLPEPTPLRRALKAVQTRLASPFPPLPGRLSGGDLFRLFVLSGGVCHPLSPADPFHVNDRREGLAPSPSPPPPPCPIGPENFFLSSFSLQPFRSIESLVQQNLLNTAGVPFVLPPPQLFSPPSKASSSYIPSPSLYLLMSPQLPKRKITSHACVFSHVFLTLTAPISVAILPLVYSAQCCPLLPLDSPFLS